MKRNPIYVFKNGTSTGISAVPLESIIQVIDYDGIGTPSMTQIIGKVGIVGSTTIAQYLANPVNYKELDRYIEDLSDISDVVVSSVIAGEVLRFNGIDWVNDSVSNIAGDITLGDLSDVATPVLGNDGQYLKWDNAAGNWAYANSISVLNDLDDVNATPSSTHSQILSYNIASKEWEAADIHGGTF